jgi:hypothetical protein
MKNLILFFIIFTISNCVKAQVLLIDKQDNSYLISQLTLKAKNKTCRVINCLSKEYIEHSGMTAKPLFTVKVFDYRKTTGLSSRPVNAIKFDDYIKTTALSKLAADMLLRLPDLESTNSNVNLKVFDSVVIYDGRNYQLLEGGIVLAEFFNIYPFTQLHPLQTNQSVFNTKAGVVKIYSWTKDSIPVPKIDALIGGKMFLLKVKNDSYTFFRHPFMCSDCPLTFYNEYIYKKDYGIIAFKSKYLYPNTDTEFRLAGNVLESDEYYYFR